MRGLGSGAIARLQSASRGDSAIHRLHPAARILGALALLVSIATLRGTFGLAVLLYIAVLIGAAAAARVPVIAMLRAGAAVLPFACCFGVVSLLAGDPQTALWLLIRAYLSSLTALLLVATTPMTGLMAGLEWLRAPRFLVQVMQFLYRYMTVLVEEANAMRVAGLARAGSLRTLQFRQAAQALGVLFARSYARAEAIHRAMVSRGFTGRLPVLSGAPGRAPFRALDAGFVAAAALIGAGLRAI